MENTIGRKIIIAVTLLLCLGLAAAAIHFNSLEKEKVRCLETLRAEANPLEHKKWKLEQELKSLERSYTSQMRGIGTASILVTELKEEVYSELYPLMEEYGMTGILTVSKDQFPGGEGQMTEDQFSKMLEGGWAFCLIWDGKTELSAWLDENRRFLKKKGLDTPQAVYFPYNTYSTDFDETLLKNGVPMAVHHGEEGLKLIVTEAEEASVWHPGAYMWNTSGIQSAVERAMDDGGSLVLTVGFTETEERFHGEYFEDMLKKLEKWQEGEELLVTDLAAARSCRTDAEKNRGGYEAELSKKRRVLQEEIDGLEEEIHAIYNKFTEEYGEEP